MNFFKRLLAKNQPSQSNHHNEPLPRKVMLFCRCDGGMKIVDAVYTQAGWVARYHNNDDSWCLLKDGGEVVGKDYVTRWFPYSGWETQDTQNSIPCAHITAEQAKDVFKKI
jgi:hypothetical protein